MLLLGRRGCDGLFEMSTRNLLTFGATAGVGYHLALSVVGTERLLESSGPRHRHELARVAMDPPVNGGRDSLTDGVKETS